jgi:hypothetical protein
MIEQSIAERVYWTRYSFTGFIRDNLHGFLQYLTIHLQDDLNSYYSRRTCSIVFSFLKTPWHLLTLGSILVSTAIRWGHSHVPKLVFSGSRLSTDEKTQAAEQFPPEISQRRASRRLHGPFLGRVDTCALAWRQKRARQITTTRCASMGSRLQRLIALRMSFKKAMASRYRSTILVQREHNTGNLK